MVAEILESVANATKSGSRGPHITYRAGPHFVLLGKEQVRPRELLGSARLAVPAVLSAVGRCG